MIYTTTFRRLGILICASIFSLGAVLALAQTGLAQSVPATVARTMPPVIVIGFVGGFIKHDNLVHSEVQLAARLRKAYSMGVDVETFESYHGKKARAKVLSLLDTNHDGTLTPYEKQNSRIIIYGHSWGGSEAIALARELGRDGIPVLLTIQVDSISKIHQNDAVIPVNVAQAANFYQPDGLLHGQPKIRAADPARTRIIGNFRFDYKASPYKCGAYPWYDRMFVKSHTQIECDPNVWKQAESLIRSNLPATTGNGGNRSGQRLPFGLALRQRYTTEPALRGAGSAMWRIETTSCAVDAEGHINAAVVVEVVNTFSSFQVP